MVNASTKTRSYRRWSPEERRAIAFESFDPLKTVTAVARKHGVSAVSLYLWRKEFGALAAPDDDREKAVTGTGGDQRGPVEPASASASDNPGRSGGGAPAGQRDDRIHDLERQLAQVQAELAASKRQRALLLSVLTSMGSQLKLLAEMEEASSPPSADETA